MPPPTQVIRGRKLAPTCYFVLAADAAWLPGWQEAGVFARVQIFLEDDPPTEIARAEAQLHVLVGDDRDGTRLGVQLAMHILLDPDLQNQLQRWEATHQCTLIPRETRVHHACPTLHGTDVVGHSSITDDFVRRLMIHYPQTPLQWHPATHNVPWFQEIAEEARAARWRIPLHSMPMWTGRHSAGETGHAPRVYIVKSPPDRVG